VRVAPEGWPFIGIAWALGAVAVWAALKCSPWWWAAAIPVLALALWVVAFFRDPVRAGPRGDGVVISPADGRIVSVVEVDEPTYLKTRAVRVSIFMSVFDVHVNRYPVSGTIEYRHYNAGQFLHAASDKASLDNEQSSVGVRGARGPVLVRQIAGLIARRIVTDGKVGDRVTQSERLGMIRFGSRVDVFVPLASRPRVRVHDGDVVKAGATLLAEVGP